MSYNMAAGNGDLARIAESIRAVDPDLVALQEVDVHWAERSKFEDQAAALGEQLRMQVRFARIYQLASARPALPAREYGVALLSRHPIASWANHALTRLSTQQQAPVPEPMPGFLEAHVQLQGSTIRVFNTHLDYRPDPSVRRQQVSEMLAIIGDANLPTLLLGDLNAQPDASELRPLLQRLRDAWPAEAGPGHTYPAAEPVRRIDYVLISEHFRVQAARVPVTVASDHRPVVVELVLRRAP
jgi:endonuclease/exonuclease/phosphatase family metal-dependent hydrolase